VHMAKTGDVILLHNTVTCNTALVRCATASRWDHIGLVVCTPTVKGHHKMLLEACGEGVVATGLDCVLRNVHQGVAFYRELNKKLNDEQEKRLFHEVARMVGRPYKQQWMSLLKAVFHQDDEGWNSLVARISPYGCCDYCLCPTAATRRSESSLQEVFCSELVAHMYQVVGLLGKERAADHYFPKDFSTDTNANVDSLLDGFSLLRELRIVHRGQSHRFHYRQAHKRQAALTASLSDEAQESEEAPP